MKMTFRWFGEADDTIELSHIRQVPGVTGIVGALTHIPPGEMWPYDEILAYKRKIEEHGLELEVIESVNIHEDIKLGLETRDGYIENYIKTIKNLGKAGVKVICYNFMPVFDWLRTNLAEKLADGSFAMLYDQELLKNKTPVQIVRDMADGSKGFSLPGWEPERLRELQTVLEQYENVTRKSCLIILNIF